MGQARDASKTSRAHARLLELLERIQSELRKLASAKSLRQVDFSLLPEQVKEAARYLAAIGMAPSGARLMTEYSDLINQFAGLMIVDVGRFSAAIVAEMEKDAGPLPAPDVSNRVKLDRWHAVQGQAAFLATAVEDLLAQLGSRRAGPKGQGAPNKEGTPGDGPTPPNRFWWKGHNATLEPNPWGVVNFLWQAKNRTAHVDEIARAVWKDEEIGERALASAVTRAKRCFEEHSWPLDIVMKNSYYTLEVFDQ